MTTSEQITAFRVDSPQADLDDLAARLAGYGFSGPTAEFLQKAGYQKIQQTRPQTLSFGLTDSPAGQLAWNAELWTGWGDHADGGHFAYTTHPDLVVGDLREFFAGLA